MKVKPTAEEQIKKIIDDICIENSLKAPISVFQAAKMIYEYKDLDTAISLYEEAEKETSGNIFRTSAFSSVLETYLIPEKTGIPFVFNFNKKNDE